LLEGTRVAQKEAVITLKPTRLASLNHVDEINRTNDRTEFESVAIRRMDSSRKFRVDPVSGASVNQQDTAVVGVPRSVLDVFAGEENRPRPRLPDGDCLHEQLPLFIAARKPNAWRFCGRRPNRAATLRRSTGGPLQAPC
jgi:hypothetical protein